MKIRNQLMMMFIVVIVPVFGAGVYLISSMIGILQSNVVQEAFKDTENLSSRLTDTLYTTATVADRVYSSEDINFLLNNSFQTEKEYTDYYSEKNMIADYLKAYDQIVDITFYIEKENFVYNSDFRQLTESIMDSYWYKDILNYKTPRWQVMQNPEDEKNYLTYVRQVFDSSGSSMGVMVIYISPEWIEGLMKNEVFSVLFSVQNGMVFYSNMPEYETGKVFSLKDMEFHNGQNGTEEITENCPLTRKGYTVVSYFDYEKTANLFQIYLVKPYSVVTGETQRLIVTFVWYVVLCFLLSVLITYLFSGRFASRIQQFRDRMHSVALGDFNVDVPEHTGEDEINDLYVDLQRMVESMQTLMNEAYEAKIQSEAFKLNQMEAEFKTLASQINPHFLYNTLETIRMKAYCNDDKETADLVKKLGKFMRRCLEVKDGMVTLESELEFTKSYLELQGARFGDRVSYSIYCEVDRNFMILPLIIQPIVENAFVHGIESSKNNGHISVKIFYKSDFVIIDVIDNGQGIPDDKMSELRWKLVENDTSSGKSIGLTNVNKRIKMYHGEKYGLSVTSEVGKGTRIRITLPRTSEDIEKQRKELIEKSVRRL